SALASNDGRAVGTLLIIDDDPHARELLRRTFSKEGYAVIEAADGASGIELALTQQPDVITLDVMMPGMDGWEVLSRIKADPATTDIPVIMVSIIDDVNMGVALGASDYVTKPIDRDRLTAILSRFKADGDARRVLVVEDDGATRQLLRRLLKKEGWAVSEAENGRVALERIEEIRPSLILLDLVMPEMDGFEFLDELRKKSGRPGIPTVVITAKDLTEQDRNRLNGSVDRIVQKGAYSREDLLAQVRDLVTSYVPGESRL
ncbi:MAG: response regulator, partial [Planctomycetota bacterium]